jgi:ribosome recycling factor
MKLSLEVEEIKNIQNLINNRINELRDKFIDEDDKEDELREIIRYYKGILKKIDEQIK